MLLNLEFVASPPYTRVCSVEMADAKQRRKNKFPVYRRVPSRLLDSNGANLPVFVLFFDEPLTNREIVSR